MPKNNSRVSPQEADERGGGGGGGSDTIFFRLNIFGSIFQTQSRGTHPTSQTSMTSTQKIHNYVCA